MAMGPFGGQGSSNPLTASSGVNPLGAATGQALDLATPGNGAPMGGLGAMNAGNVAVMQALMGNNGFGFQTPGAGTPPVSSGNLSPQDYMSSLFTLLGANPSPLLPLTGPQQPGMPSSPMQTPSMPQAAPQAPQTNPGFRRVTSTTPSPTPNIPPGWHEVGTNQQGVIVQPLSGTSAFDPTGAGTGAGQGWLYDPSYTGASGPQVSGRSNTWIIPEPPPQTTTKFVRK